MKIISLHSANEQFQVQIGCTDHNASIQSGNFHAIRLSESEIFKIKLEFCEKDGENSVKEITSRSVWEKVRTETYPAFTRFSFINPEGIDGITAVYTAVTDDRGISWTCEIINDSEKWSVTEASYPSPVIFSETFDLFIPDGCGRVINDAGKKGFHMQVDYPNHFASMSYFSYYGKDGGLYLGIHDPDAAMKTFDIRAENGFGSVSCTFPAIGAGLCGNSFRLYGEMRWELLSGDWFDAAQIYGAFVKKAAKWLPVIDENGRPDTPEKFKEIPFWVVDYVPNSKEQMDARPMTLGTVSQLYDETYWYQAPIALKERLGTPMAYHVYNWHHNPFNINYPHFTPEKDGFVQGLAELKKHDIYVMPYINAVSWEENDADEGYSVNFSNTGKFGAAIDEKGELIGTVYPQIKRNGSKTHLMPMCPTFGKWHTIIEKEVRTIENSLDMDGIYFDEIAAHAPHPCRGKHPHLPGGGSYWSDGYNLMMTKIRAEKPDQAFYFSESNGEPYMKSFDGFLTWLWKNVDQVPAFPAIYAGYIQMLGRFTDGDARDDDLFFRYHIAESFLYGQQLGWINAAVIYNEKRMEYLERFVHMRYENTKLFQCGRLLRPPKIETKIPEKESSGLIMKQILAGAWQKKDLSETAIFIANISEESQSVEISFLPAEFSLTEENLSADIRVENGRAYLETAVKAGSCKKICL